MNIIKNAFLVMAVVDVFVIFLMICAEAISTIRRKFSKKPEKKATFDFDVYDDEEDEIEDCSALWDEPEPKFDRDYIREKPFDTSAQNFVSEVIYPKFKPMVATMSTEEAEEVNLLVTALILYLKEEAIYDEQSFPMVRYMLKCMEEDTTGEFRCPVEMLLEEAAERKDEVPAYLTKFKAVKHNSKNLHRTIQLSIKLMDKVIQRLYRDYFRTRRDFGSDVIDTEILLAGVNLDYDKYIMKDEVE